MAKVAVVTGGTRGIGEAMSIALNEAGYSVVANYACRDADAQKFNDATGISVYKFDVADLTACRAGIETIKSDLGPVAVLVNNAGITSDAPLHRMTEEQWASVVHTDLDSVFAMSRSVIDGMRERGFGRIINVGSINGQKGQFGQTNYSAAKAGVIGFTKALALETAAKGITVNCVAPGYIATEMVRAMPEEVLNTKVLPLIPVGRLGEAVEIARCAVFLARDDSGFITGSTLTANGGQYLT